MEKFFNLLQLFQKVIHKKIKKIGLSGQARKFSLGVLEPTLIKNLVGEIFEPKIFYLYRPRNPRKKIPMLVVPDPLKTTCLTFQHNNTS